MSTLNRAAYHKLLSEDYEWLMRQPRSLERDHLAAVLVQLSADLLAGVVPPLEEKQTDKTGQSGPGKPESEEARSRSPQLLDYADTLESWGCSPLCGSEHDATCYMEIAKTLRELARES